VNKVEEMLSEGYSMDEIIDHLMRHGLDDNRDTEIEKRMKHLTQGLSLSIKEQLDLLRIQLGTKCKARLEKMLQDGKPIEDVFGYFMKHGKTEEEEQAESCRMLKKFLSTNSMDETDVLNFVRNQFGADMEGAMKTMLCKGYTIEEVIERTEQMFREGHDVPYITKYFNENVGTKAEEREKINMELTKLLSKKNLSDEEMLKVVREKFGYKAEAAMREMLRSGQNIEQAINQLIEDGIDERKETELEKRMKILLKGKVLSPEENLELLKSQLGPEAREKLEQMLKQGKSADYIWRYFMKHGETKEQEEGFIGPKLQKILTRNSLTKEQILKLMNTEFGSEIETIVKELFRNGYTVKEIIDLLQKLLSQSQMNKKDLIRILKEKVRQKSGSVSDSDVFGGNVFLIIDIEEAKEKIPYMHPSGKMNVFRTFFKKLHMFVSGKGLTHDDILDLIRSRLGGQYGKEFDMLRKEGGGLQAIVEFFLKKDEQMRQEARRRAKLVGQSRIDTEYAMYRKALKERWGVIMHYSYSKEYGLHLIFNSVSPEGPAWACGARPGDVIKTINYWKVYLMDQPHCAAHLFQAAGKTVRLGIMKTPVEDEDKGAIGIY